MARERNFEVIRTVAMFLIVLYHCLTHGVGNTYGFSATQSVTLSNVLFSDFMLVFSSISVNLYVMISGYFLVDLSFKMSRIVRTWINACFYSCVITLIFMSLGLIPFSIITMGKSAFPLSTDAYWFVTQYVGLLILSPFLSLLARQLTYRQYLLLLVGGAFLCLSIIPDFPLAKRFHVAHGNSVWSFAYLFLIAAFIKHHIDKVSSVKLASAIVCVILLTLVMEIFYGYQNGIVYLYWFDYNALPFILSVLVFVMIRQIHVPNNGLWKILVRCAPYTFGVYLIHDHLLIRDRLWEMVSLPSQCDKLQYPLIVIGLCMSIFIICALIDSIQKKLFSVFKIDSTITKIDKWSYS